MSRQPRSVRPVSADDFGARGSPSRLGLELVLEAVHEFGSASLGLVAWEFSVTEAAVRPGWELALRSEHLILVGVDPDHGESMYALSERGERCLTRLRQRGARRAR